MSDQETGYIVFAKYADPVPVRVMARADGYAMVAAEAGLPFIVTERDLERAAAIKDAKMTLREKAIAGNRVPVQSSGGVTGWVTATETQFIFEPSENEWSAGVKEPICFIDSDYLERNYEERLV